MSSAVAVTEVARNAYWREHDARVVIEAWQQSGEPMSRFAKRHGVDARRLARWVARLEPRDTKPVRFHAVRLAAAEGGAREVIEVRFGDGWSVRVPRGFEPEDLRRVLAVLGERESC
jgi:hypothetical protein